MKKIELNQSKLQLTKEKITPLGKGAASKEDLPTTTILISIMRICAGRAEGKR